MTIEQIDADRSESVKRRDRLQPLDETRTMLRDFFRPYNRLLLDLIKDKRFEHWLS